MSSAKKRDKYTQSIISLCLLIVLLVVGICIIILQSNFDLSRFGITASSIAVNQMEKSLPQAAGRLYQIEGFVPVADAAEYIEETLYEKINGKAPLYTDAGFVKLTTQVLAAADDDQLQMELYIYDMGAPRNAFSVYSTQKRSDSENLTDMTFGYKTANAVYFAHNKYYVELIGFSQSEELIDKMTKLAPVMLKNEPETEIAELDYFPAENLITASQKLYLINAFGFEQFSDVFTADYNINGQQITAFLGEKPNVQDAAASAKAYYDFLISMGAEAKSAEDNNLDIKILDTFGYVEIIFTIGDFVGGVHQAQNQEAAEQLAKELINKLSVCSKK